MSVSNILDILKARKAKFNDHQARGVTPIYFELGAGVSSSAGQEYGFWAKTLMTEGGLSGCAVAEILEGNDIVDVIGALTAVWMPGSMAIATLFERYDSRLQEIIEKHKNKRIHLADRDHLKTLYGKAQLTEIYYIIGQNEEGSGKTWTDIRKERLFSLDGKPTYGGAYERFYPGMYDALPSGKKISQADRPTPTPKWTMSLQCPTWDHFSAMTTAEKVTALNYICYSKDNKNTVARAVFVALSAIAKGGSVTTHWVDTRFSRFKEFAGFSDMQGVKNTDISTYRNKYVPMNINPRALTEFLYMMYVQFDADNVSPGKWIIEQSVGLNTTALGAVATLLLKHNYSYEYLSKRFGIGDEIDRAAAAMYQLIKNPWINVVTPKTPLRQYANLAYLAVITIFPMKYTATTLKGMASLSLEIESEVNYQLTRSRTEGARLGIADATMKAYPKANILIRNDSMWAYSTLVNDPTPSETTQDPANVVVPNLRTNPNYDISNLVEVSFKDLMVKYASPRDTLLKGICQEYLNTTTQRGLSTTNYVTFMTPSNSYSLTDEQRKLLNIPDIKTEPIQENSDLKFAAPLEPVNKSKPGSSTS
ncbi:hypothetical protein 2 [Atrato Chu-like virus 5]|uniref:Uncharacterized protein n=1 Tax=Atrato Chu-like virus 5 TaxID=2689325 RepID=A0A6B9KG56_9VIRU|nr:hypothetical protein 2 [Atrato Chu-like virus 5]QHA33674.1 hypothetical protein 2 [Atrato Chu-like virus 5]